MRVLQVKPVQTKARLIKQEIRFGYSVKITIEACVPGYFKVGILFLCKVNIYSTYSRKHDACH